MSDDLNSSNFTQPQGLLNPDRFPDGIDLATYLDTWINRGQEEAGHVEPGDHNRRVTAVEHYVYYRAWDFIWEKLTGEPSEVNVQQEWQASFTNAQILSYKERRDERKEKFESIVSTHGDDNEAPGHPGARSQVVSNDTGF